MIMVLKQGRVETEVGSKELVHSLFSTVAVRLEGGKWGSRFPVVMNQLSKGSLTHEHCQAAMAEMKTIRQELQKFKPDQVVFDAKDLKAKPANIADIILHLGTLATCHTTIGGRSLIDEIVDNLESQRQFGGLLQIISK